ncbi:hypothetical protein WICPIJ_004123 [Wickerhamomyces pijperi]|uniref:Uncharacterized protein n=1 Tax=Wickerhamomyces pijperi TaxID=599730 RepID=A0A9P8Q8N9_WICPI|nr:hypothetical protein WICPIJ_004123 [Wickerhamomyces pijperi]
MDFSSTINNSSSSFSSKTSRSSSSSSSSSDFFSSTGFGLSGITNSGNVILPSVLVSMYNSTVPLTSVSSRISKWSPYFTFNSVKDFSTLSSKSKSYKILLPTLKAISSS